MDAARLMKAAPIGVPVRSGCPDTEGGPCGAERTAMMVDRSMFSHCGDAMSPPVDHVQSDLRLPSHAGVVIIGGGIIGVSTALFLAEKGHAVVLCEKGRIGGEQSSRNWGWCHTVGRNAGEILLAMESLHLWRGMNERINGDTGFRQPGIMCLSRPTPRSPVKKPGWIRRASTRSMPTFCVAASWTASFRVPAPLSSPACTHQPTDARNLRKRHPPSPRQHVARGRYPDQLRCTWHRSSGRAHRRRGHRERPHHLRLSRAGRRRLVAAVLWQCRHRFATTEYPRLGAADQTAGPSAGDYRRRLCLRIQKTAGRRLFDRPS